jgi:serine/threonine-protein kinase
MVDESHAPTVPDTEAPSSQAGSDPPSFDSRYALRGLLGRGGMGEVWLARDVRVQRDVAIKWMRGEGARDPGSVARFLREARVQGQLEHPAIVPVHDIGGTERSPYFVMKRLAGTTLADVLAVGVNEQWTRRTLLARLVDACLAIELAHSRGVIHRDLKPANIMLGDLGETYVLDWGLAREGGAADTPTPPVSRVAHGETAAGAMMGTPGYMSPEQMRGERVDARTDVFALGCVLFEVLAGEPAIAREVPFEHTLAAAHHRPSERRRDVEIPPELDDLCARATAAVPAERLASAKLLADGIQRFLDGDRDLERRRELAAEQARAADTTFAAGGDSARAEAMRGAGRAIALDPTNAAAQQLLARLLLEPPRELPTDVKREIERDRDVASRVLLRKGAVGEIWNLGLLGLASALGIASDALVGMLAVSVVMIVCLLWWLARRERPPSNLEIGAIVVLHGSQLVVVSMLGSPLLLGPLFAFGALPMFLMYPGKRMPIVALLVHAGAIALPLVLETIGVLPPTFWITRDALVIEPMVGIKPAVLVGIAVAIVFVQMVVDTFILDGQRKTQEAAEQRQHLQSWHLRQLVR